MYTPQHFRIEELVGPEFHKANKPRGDLMFMAFDQLALVTLDRLRKRYGPVVVNNWHQGGAFHESGLRDMGTGTGAALSQHKFGRAFDCKFRNVAPAEVWAELQASPNLSCFEFIQRIEAGAGMTWFHFDTGGHDRFDTAVAVVSYRGDRAGLPVFVRRG
ncbi:hypothetical protein [Desulfovibrio psychrotolerans]|uniref:Peptidase M15 n=1 Tax=Desulfovibrio psychrotolerans TaxID=415242 RepID=A0A7J0BYS1_9BACT|nr:hypothetical protein [Desulfovibrio psychrotolerans]GFM38301.1 hypothetical protein DSM19430T_29850 [Desulfovibrio psychrotolerans]